MLWNHGGFDALLFVRRCLTLLGQLCQQISVEMERRWCGSLLGCP